MNVLKQNAENIPTDNFKTGPQMNLNVKFIC